MAFRARIVRKNFIAIS